MNTNSPKPRGTSPCRQCYSPGPRLRHGVLLAEQAVSQPSRAFGVPANTTLRIAEARAHASAAFHDIQQSARQ